VRRCEIADERINAIADEVNSEFIDVDTKTLFGAVIRCADNTSVSFVLNEDSTRLGPAIEKIKAFNTSADNVTVTYARPGEMTSEESFAVRGGETLTQSYLGKKFSYDVQGFFQNNHDVAEKMLAYCVGILQKENTKESCLLDLYGGVGVFGIAASKLFRQVLIVESFAKSVEAAKTNIERNNAKNVNVVAANARSLKRMEIPRGRELLVITDPPRTGMDPETILHLKELEPAKIIYISCNPEQLAKDLKKFSGSGYSIKSAALFDMFPQTKHTEAVFELEQK